MRTQIQLSKARMGHKLECCPVTHCIFFDRDAKAHTRCQCGHCRQCDHKKNKPGTTHAHFRTRAGDVTPKLFKIVNLDEYCNAPVCDCLNFKVARKRTQ